jgi:hypothetical protein
VKLDVDTLATVPDAPPGAGFDRALDPPPPDPKPPAEPLPDPGRPAVAEGDMAVAEGDMARPTESPITAHISAAATIHPLLLLDSNRRAFGRTAAPAAANKVSLRENMETTSSVRWNTPSLASRGEAPPGKG